MPPNPTPEQRANHIIEALQLKHADRLRDMIAEDIREAERIAGQRLPEFNARVTGSDHGVSA